MEGGLFRRRGDHSACCPHPAADCAVSREETALGVAPCQERWREFRPPFGSCLALPPAVAPPLLNIRALAPGFHTVLMVVALGACTRVALTDACATPVEASEASGLPAP